MAGWLGTFWARVLALPRPRVGSLTPGSLSVKWMGWDGTHLPGIWESEKWEGGKPLGRCIAALCYCQNY